MLLRGCVPLYSITLRGLSVPTDGSIMAGSMVHVAVASSQRKAHHVVACVVCLALVDHRPQESIASRLHRHLVRGGQQTARRNDQIEPEVDARLILLEDHALFRSRYRNSETVTASCTLFRRWSSRVQAVQDAARAHCKHFMS